MDSTKEFVEMCSKATEIQQMAKINEKYWKFSKGDRIAFQVEGREMQFRFVDDFIPNECVWLPRMDQLSSMITTWNQKYSIAFFQNIASNSMYRNLPKGGFDSIEKHLLHFMMMENYNKVWNFIEKDWISI